MTTSARMPWDTTGLPTIERVRERIALEGPQAVHDAYCEGGVFRVMEGTYDVMFLCPKCTGDATRVRAQKHVQDSVRESGIGRRYWDVTWDSLEMVPPLPALRAAASDIGSIITAGHNLILCGEPGSGKTQAAVLLMRAAIEADRTTALVNVGRVGMEIRAGYDQAGGITEASETARLTSVDLLVLDDVGVGEAGDAKIERRLLYFVAEARTNAQRPTIITSNLSAKELLEFLGTRVLNRLMPVEVMAFTHGRNFRMTSEGTLWNPEGSES